MLHRQPPVARRAAAIALVISMGGGGLAAAQAPAPAPAVKTAPGPRPPPVAPAPAPTASAAPAPTSSAEGTALAKKIQQFYAEVPALSASFQQVVRKKGLKKGIQRKGKVWLKRGRVVADGGKDGKPQVENGRMRWDYPDEEVFYFSDGETLWSYERRERVALRLPVKDSRLYQSSAYLLGQGDLAADFHLQVGASPVKDTVALEMVPKDGTAVMQKLTLIVDAKTYAVLGSILVDPLGDSTSLFFSDLRYSALEDSLFVWTPPAGVTVRTP